MPLLSIGGALTLFTSVESRGSKVLAGRGIGTDKRKARER